MSDVRVIIRRKSLTARMVNGTLEFVENFVEEVRHMPAIAAAWFRSDHPGAVASIDTVIIDEPKSRDRYRGRRGFRQAMHAGGKPGSVPTHVPPTSSSFSLGGLINEELRK